MTMLPFEMASTGRLLVRPGGFPDEGGLLLGERKHQPGTLESQCVLLDGMGVNGALRFHNRGTLLRPDVIAVPQMTEEDEANFFETTRMFGVVYDIYGSGFGKGVPLVAGDYPEMGYPMQPYRGPQQLLDEYTMPMIEQAQRFQAQGHFDTLVRGFAGNPKPGTDSLEMVDTAVELLEPSLKAWTDAGFRVGLELETKTLGDTAASCVAFVKALANQKVGLVIDFGNIASQGDDLWDAWVKMRDHIINIHVKHYIGPRPEVHGPINEHALEHYALAIHGVGQDCLDAIFSDLAARADAILARLAKIGLTLLPVDVEGHVVGGGPKGGISTPLGFNLTVMALFIMLARHKIGWQQKGWDEIVRRRGIAAGK